MRNLDNAQDQQGQDVDLRPVSDSIYQLDLTADVSERITIPADAKAVIFSCTQNYWIKVGDNTATAANTGDVSNGSASELNPAGYTLDTGETHIAAISDSNAIITMAFYRLGHIPKTS